VNDVRLDKWLYAARFFKTRALARQAVEKGHVLVDGQRAKPGRDMRVGQVLQVQQAGDSKVVAVLALSDTRGPATQAQALYVESDESRRVRESAAALRKVQRLSEPYSEHKPNKKERRQLLQWLDS
jgi:ribosome-associated heat shock protein Hsp15